MVWSLLASVSANSPAGSGAFTSSAIDTTGADLLVVCAAVANGTFSDSKTNTWTDIGPVGTGAGGASTLIIKAIWHPTVGSGHTFSYSASPGSPNGSLVALAYSGSLVASTAIDQSNGNNNGGTPTTTVQAGSITPLADGELIISAASNETVTGASVLSINLGFSELFELPHVVGQSYGLAVASLIQTPAAAINPTWTCSGSAQMISIIASFKVEPAAAPSTLTWLPRQQILRGPRGQMTASGPVPPTRPEP